VTFGLAEPSSRFLANVVAIPLSSNRPFEAPVFDEVMKTLLAQLHERVIFINVHRLIGWEFYVNKNLQRASHLSTAGSQAYVNALQDKLDTRP
jgi:hypothetical protein